MTGAPILLADDDLQLMGTIQEFLVIRDEHIAVMYFVWLHKIKMLKQKNPPA